MQIKSKELDFSNLSLKELLDIYSMAFWSSRLHYIENRIIDAKLGTKALQEIMDRIKGK